MKTIKILLTGIGGYGGNYLKELLFETEKKAPERSVRPENGAAQVEVTIRTGTMQMPVEEMLTRLSHQPCVVEIHRGV